MTIKEQSAAIYAIIGHMHKYFEASFVNQKFCEKLTPKYNYFKNILDSCLYITLPHFFNLV